NLAYHDLLGREADAAGLAGWFGVLAHGGTMTDMRAGIAASTEFTSGSDFLDRLYNRALNRSADDGGRDFWNGLLAAGASRFDVAHAVFSSSECLGSEVDAFYQNFLDRAGDAAGRAFWISALHSGRDDLVRAGILGSLEYFDHVNPV